MAVRSVQSIGIVVVIVTVLPTAFLAGPPRRAPGDVIVDRPGPVVLLGIEVQPPNEPWSEPPATDSSVCEDVVPSACEHVVETPLPVSGRRQARTLLFEGWQLLPEGLLFHSYAAGEKEPRFAAQWLWERERGLVWETALGGRMGIVRRGTVGPVDPQGFQVDIEGGALTRVDPEHHSDLEAADFRIGVVGTWRYGRWRYKAGYAHLSSHVGDEFLIANPDFPRRNYVRDSIVAAVMYDVTPDLQAYAQVAGALNANGGAEPIELQFGAQYLPAARCDWRGAPFAAINGDLRQEFDMGGSVNLMAGWMWRGGDDHTYRIGLQHYSGPSLQYSFFDQYESLTGWGMWMDF